MIVYDTTTTGYLRGPTPKGKEVVVEHLKRGASGYRLYYQNRWLDRLGAKEAEECFGICPRRKNEGGQAGYTSQPTIMAFWQHLACRHNNGYDDVVFSTVDPTVIRPPT